MSKIYDDFIEIATPVAKELLFIKEITKDDNLNIALDIDGMVVELSAKVIGYNEIVIEEPQRSPVMDEYAGEVPDMTLGSDTVSE